MELNKESNKVPQKPWELSLAEEDHTGGNSVSNVETKAKYFRTNEKTKGKQKENPAKGIEFTATGKKHAGGGIRTSFHGYMYQAQLLLLFMKRALTLGYEYNIATEVADAGALDDVVFEYKENGSYTYRFLQAKHKQDDKNTITEQDLITKDPKGDFSVVKYFKSYCEMKNARRPLFRGWYKDFTICTNINIDSNLEENFCELEENDELLSFNKAKYAPNSRRLKLQKDCELYKTLVAILKAVQDDNYKIIVKKLATETAKKYIETKHQKKRPNKKKFYTITVDKTYKDNRDWIFKNILDEKSLEKEQKCRIKLRYDFLNPGKNESKQKLNETFLEAFIDYINNNTSESIQATDDTKNQIREQLAEVYLELPKSLDDETKGKDKVVSLPEYEVDVFLEKLVFAVSQPNNNQLKNIIKDEMNDMNLDDGGLIAGHSLACIFDWIKEKQGNFGSGEDFRNLLVDIERQLILIRLTAFGLNQRATIDQHGFAFQNKGISKQIINFLKSDNNILYLFCYDKLLTVMKLMQLERQKFEDVTKNLSTRIDKGNHDKRIDETETGDITERAPLAVDKVDRRWLFMYFEIANFMTHIGTKICPIEAFRSKVDTPLVLDLTDSTELENAKELTIKLFNNITDIKSKKLIILIPHEFRVNLTHTFMLEERLKEIKSLDILDTENSFDDLTQESQQKLLNEGSLNIRGCEIHLRDVDSHDLRQWLKENVLSQLIQHKLTVLEDITDHHNDEVDRYYIDRNAWRCVLISRDILSDNRFFLWQGEEVDQGKEIIVVSDSKDDYDNFCENNKEVKSHWLKFVEKKYLWQESKGSMQHLRDYLCKSRKHKGAPLNSQDCMESRIVIISAEPGMGKSTVLSRMAKQSTLKKPGFLTIKTDLRNYFKEFRQMPEGKVDMKHAVAYLYRFVYTGTASNLTPNQIDEIFLIDDDGTLILKSVENKVESIQLKLFTYLYNERKIIMLFDGFDEIAPDYTYKVLNWLATLKKSRLHKIWVTTRPYNIQDELENRLDTFSFKLMPLTITEQKLFLYKFWDQKMSWDNLNHFFSRIALELNSNSMDYQTEFMGIPLHIWMIATIYENNFCTFNDRTDTSDWMRPSTINDIYSDFFKIKFKLFWKEVDEDDPKFSKEYKDKFSQKKRQYQKMAFMELFNKNEIPEELVSEDDWEKYVKEVESAEEKTGLVTRVEGGRPIFLHRTFAEYFAADLLVDALMAKTEQSKRNKRKYEAAKNFLYHILTEKYFPGIITFLNYKIASFSDQVLVLNSAIAGDMSGFQDHYLKIRDALGRSLTHLIFGRGRIDKDLEQFICKLTPNHFDTLFLEDELYAWTPLHYAIACHNCVIVNAYRDCNFKYTGSRKMNVKDERGLTPHILAVRRGCSNVCLQAFLGGLPLNVNAQDGDGKTALHYALARPDGASLALTLLCHYKADIFAKDSTGQIPFDIIVQKPRFLDEFLRYISRNQSKNKYTIQRILERISEIAELSCRVLSSTGAKFLMAIDNNIDINVRDQHGRTALHYAFENLQCHDYESPLLHLIRKNARIDVRDNQGRLPSYYGTTYQELIETFDRGYSYAKFNILDKIVRKKMEIMTPFILSMEFNKDIAVRVLSRYEYVSEVLLNNNKIDINTRDADGRTGLHYAVMHKRSSNVVHLLNRGDNVLVLAQDKFNKTALQYLSAKHTCVVTLRILMCLLTWGACYDVANDFENHFLIRSTRELFNAVELNDICGIRGVMSRLSAANTSVVVNARNKEMKRPIHVAVMNERPGIVKLLLSYGAYTVLGRANDIPLSTLTNNKEIRECLELYEKNAFWFY